MRFPVAMLLMIAVAAHGQWIDYKVAGVPRTADGMPNLAAAAPRVNSKADFSGLWMTDAAPEGWVDKAIPGMRLLAVPGDDPAMLPKYFINVLADYAPDDIQVTPDGQKLMAQARANVPGGVRCLPAGFPMSEFVPLPHRYIQTGYMLAILYESELPRQIHLDGRPLPADPQPAWRGYSVGKWEGDTLVVETIGLHPGAPLDGFNHPKSPEMRIVERMSRRDYGHMDVQLTITDPAYYSKPIVIQYAQTLVPDGDLLEYICLENEKDLAHIPPPAPPQQR
jgi:hypothetical protein